MDRRWDSFSRNQHEESASNQEVLYSYVASTIYAHFPILRRFLPIVFKSSEWCMALCWKQMGIGLKEKWWDYWEEERLSCQYKERTLSRLFLAVGRISIPPLSLFLSTVFTRDSMKRVGIHGINTTAGLPSLDGETAWFLSIIDPARI